MEYPKQAFAYTDGDKNYFRHHFDSVKRAAENRSVDITALIKSFYELRRSKLSSLKLKKAYNHLKNHAKVILSGKIPSQAEDRDYTDDLSELQFLINDIQENGITDNPELVKLPPTPIMKIGIWNGQEFDMKRLERILRNFKHFKKSFLPALKQGHEQGFGLFAGIENDQEALGYVTDLFIENDKLMAVFEFIPEIYETKILNRTLRYKSSEIWRKFPSNGKDYEDVLTAVALLGIDPPAVEGLGEIPLAQFKADDKQNHSCFAVVFDTQTDDYYRKEEESMEDVKKEELKEEEIKVELEEKEEVKEEEEKEDVEEEVVEEESEEETDSEAETEAEDEIEAEESSNELESEEASLLSAKEQEILELKKKIDEQNNLIISLAREQDKRERVALVEDLIKDGHLLPAEREQVEFLFSALDNSQTMKFEKETVGARKVFEEFLRSRKAWTKEEFSKAEETEINDALPKVPVEDEQLVKCSGSYVPVKNAELAEKAKALFEKYRKEGRKDVTFADCILAVSK